MAFQQRENSGSLFENDRKRNDKDADWSGSALIGGVEYWVSGWDKVTANGRNLRSLSFKRKDAPKGQAPQGGQQQQRPPWKQPAPRPMPPKTSQPQSGDDEVPF